MKKASFTTWHGLES